MGSSNCINIWSDPWLPSSSSSLVSSPNPQGNNIVSVNELIDDNNDYRSWKIELISSLFNREEARCISRIPLSLFPMDDLLIWKFTHNGIYSVKSGYLELKKDSINALAKAPSSSSSTSAKFWRKIWHLDCPAKVRIFWWKVCRNALATGENLFSRHCKSSPLCTICFREVESVEHVLFRCEWVMNCWSRIVPEKASSFANVISACAWFEECGVNPSCSAAWVVLCWFIWLERNRCVFDHVSADYFRVLSKFSSFCADWLAAKSFSSFSPGVSSASVSPILPEWAFFCDGAFSSSSGGAAIGGVLRGPGNSILDGFSKRISASSPFMSEALAFREACLRIARMNLVNVSVCGDCQYLISICSKDLAPPWDCSSVIHDIRVLAKQWNISFCFVGRERNRAAHWLASRARSNSLIGDWVGCPPPILVSLMYCVS